MSTIWANFLHIYQPPKQSRDVIKQVCQQSYSYIIKTLKQSPKSKITLNLSGCLTEQLLQYNQQGVLGGLKALVKKGQIELTATAKYHPLLPLLPEKEIIRQIELNQNINKAYFGTIFQPKGFYLPEMAYSYQAAKVIARLGYKWIILDEISYKGKLGVVDFNKKYKIKGLNLYTVFRSRELSKAFPPTKILEIAAQKNPPSCVVTATDGEMYGYHHKDTWRAFAKALSLKNVQTVTVSQLLNVYKKEEIIQPVSSSWESMETEIKEKNPYALWHNRKNKIHQLLTAFRKLSIHQINQHRHDVNYGWARRHLDQGLSSCTLWWASGRKIDVFSPISWNPDEIEKGANELIKSIRSLKSISSETKLIAEKIYQQIIKAVWQEHWRKYAK